MSSSRGWAAPNQPSSSRKSSAPRSAVWSMSPRIRSVSNEKKVASQLFTTIGRSASPSRTAWARTQRWKRRLSGPTPSVDHIQTCSGVTKVAPASSTYSDGRRVVPAPDPHRGGGRPIEGEAGVAAPGQRAGEDRAAQLLGRPVGGEQEEGAGAQVGLHAAARLDHLGPRREGLGGRGPLGRPVAPAEVGQVGRGSGEQGRGRGDLVQGDRPGLAVGDADPLAQHAVVVGMEATA